MSEEAGTPFDYIPEKDYTKEELHKIVQDAIELSTKAMQQAVNYRHAVQSVSDALDKRENPPGRTTTAAEGLRDSLLVCEMLMPGFGFFLFAGEHNAEGKVPHAHYGGTMDRLTALSAMEEFLKKNAANPGSWMKDD